MMWISAFLIMCVACDVLCASSQGMNDKKWEVRVTTGRNAKSGTNDPVIIEIKGDRQTTDITTTTRLEGPSEPFVLEDDIGTPYGIKVSKDGTNTLELDFVEIRQGDRNYRFDCFCWINDNAKHKLTVPRPSVSITTVCQNESRLIGCPDSYAINIIDASFGRWDNITCSASVNYDPVCYQYSPENKMKVTCQDKQECNISATIEPMTDKCLTSSSYAMIVYDCQMQVPSLTTFPVKTSSPTTQLTSEKSTTTQPTSKKSTTTQPTSKKTTTTQPTSEKPTTPISVTTVTDDTMLDTNESHCCGNLTDCYCRCVQSFYDDTGCELNDVDCVVSALRETLIVNAQMTSKFKRSKQSARDDRISSQTIGASGVVVLVAVLLIIVVPDIMQLFLYTRRKLC